MQTYAEMQDEIAKLTPNQRNTMRRICGTSRLEAVTVVRLGWKTKVDCKANGLRYVVKLGPRGAKLSKEIF